MCNKNIRLGGRSTNTERQTSQNPVPRRIIELNAAPPLLSNLGDHRCQKHLHLWHTRIWTGCGSSSCNQQHGMSIENVHLQFCAVSGLGFRLASGVQMADSTAETALLKPAVWLLRKGHPGCRWADLDAGPRHTALGATKATSTTASRHLYHPGVMLYKKKGRVETETQRSQFEPPAARRRGQTSGKDLGPESLLSS